MASMVLMNNLKNNFIFYFENIQGMYAKINRSPPFLHVVPQCLYIFL